MASGERTIRSIYSSSAAAGPAAAGAPAAAEAAAPVIASSEFDPGDFEPLYRAAFGDFLHDFNEPGRSDVTLSILNKVPIEYAKAPSKNYAGLTALIDGAKARGGKSDTVPAQAFYVFNDVFNLTMPNNVVPAVNADHEEQVLQLANIEYEAIMSKLTREAAAEGKPLILDVTPPSTDPPTAMYGFTNKHPYIVNAAATKAEGVRRPLANIFSGLADGATVFVLMWDAGAISITRLAEGAEGGPYHFFFVRSKENLSDPAGKISADTVKSTPNVRVYFLEDYPEHVSQYPIYAGGSTTNENLFSNFTLTTQLNSTNRETVTGIISVKQADGSDVNISVPDIGVQSEVSEVVVKTVHMKLNGDPSEQIMPYYFLKRAGDWCQALCLLDRDRKYIVKHAPMVNPDDGKVYKTWLDQGLVPNEGSVSIGQLEAEQNALIAMITLDRIMLAFVIAAGLHVFFTNVRGGANWLVFFRNMEAGRVDDAGQLIDEGKRELTDLAKSTAIKDAYRGVMAQMIEMPFEPRPMALGEYVINLRTLSVRLNSIPTPETVNGLLDRINELIERVNEEPTNSSLVGTLRNALTKLNNFHANLPQGPSSSSEADKKSETSIRALVEKIQTNSPEVPKPVSRNDAGFAAFFSFVDDIKRYAPNFEFPPYPFVEKEAGREFPTTRSSGGAQARYPMQLLLNRWKNDPVGGGSMRGGGRPSEFDECYPVYAFDPDNAEDIAIAGVLSLANNVATAPKGSQIMLPDGFLATVVDDVLIDDAAADGGVLNQKPGDDEDMKRYKDIRTVIYELDDIQTRIHRLRGSSAINDITKRKLYDLAIDFNNIPTPGEEEHAQEEQQQEEGEEDGRDWEDDLADTIDDLLTENIPGYPSDRVDDPEYEVKANVAMLIWIAEMEREVDARRKGWIASIPIRPHEEYAPVPEDDNARPTVAEINEIHEIAAIDDRMYVAEILAGLRNEPAPPYNNDALAAVGNAGWNGGGLRTRRPLYSNARKTTARHVDGTSNDAGLRERVGPRTTRRVRKSSRSTRRRR